MSAERNERLDSLVRATREYVEREVELAEAQVSALQEILEGRSGGTGLSQGNAQVAAAAAQNDLAAFLRGD